MPIFLFQHEELGLFGIYSSKKQGRDFDYVLLGYIILLAVF